MNQTSFQDLLTAVEALDLKINRLQYSAGVMHDDDQNALNAIEADSKQLVQVVKALNEAEPESKMHRDAVIEDQRVRPGETPEQHAQRIRTSYPHLNESRHPGQPGDAVDPNRTAQNDYAGTAPRVDPSNPRTPTPVRRNG